VILPIGKDKPGMLKKSLQYRRAPILGLAGAGGFILGDTIGTIIRNRTTTTPTPPFHISNLSDGLRLGAVMTAGGLAGVALRRAHFNKLLKQSGAKDMDTLQKLIHKRKIEEGTLKAMGLSRKDIKSKLGKKYKFSED